MWFYWRLPDATGKRKMIHTVHILYGNSFIAPFVISKVRLWSWSIHLLVKRSCRWKSPVARAVPKFSIGSTRYQGLADRVSFPRQLRIDLTMEVGCSFVSSADLVLFVLANNTRQTDQCLNNLCCSRNKASSSTSSVREQRKQMDIAAPRQQNLIDKQSYSSNHGSHDLPDASAVLF